MSLVEYAVRVGHTKQRDLMLTCQSSEKVLAVSAISKRWTLLVGARPHRFYQHRVNYPPRRYRCDLLDVLHRSLYRRRFWSIVG